MSVKKENKKIQECFIRTYDFDAFLDAVDTGTEIQHRSIEQLLEYESSDDVEEDGRDTLYRITIEKIGTLESKHTLSLKKD